MVCERLLEKEEWAPKIDEDEVSNVIMESVKRGMGDAEAEWVRLYGIMKRRTTRFGGDILITVVD